MSARTLFRITFRVVLAVLVAAGLYYFRGPIGAWFAPALEAMSPEKEVAQTAPSSEGTHGMPMGQNPPAPSSPEPTSNTVFIAPERQQLIGVKSVLAVTKPVIKEIRTIGKVAYDETKLTHIHTKVTGYIEEVFADSVGKPVKRGDPLFTIYSPDLVATQEEYLLALKSRDTLKDSSFPWVASGSTSLLEATRRRLQLWDITDEEIETLEKEGRVKRALTIYSPVSGIVIERAAYHHGRYVNPEMDLYMIVDLSTVWVLAEIYEYELPYVKEGQTVEIELPYSTAEKTLSGKITYIYPYLNEKTRTVQVRMEFPNIELTLRPEMFVNATIRARLGNQLVVPEDAVLDTGQEQYVFVDKGDGYFEPRLVRVGAEASGSYVIESGLQSKERVVTAANFILDSESRLKGVFANMGKPSTSPRAESSAMRKAVNVEILEPKGAKVGKNQVRLLVKDAEGKPIEDAEVNMTMSMPQMGAMPPMSSHGRLQHIGNGVYQGPIEIQMAWTWQTRVTVSKNGKPIGSAELTITAR